MGREIVARELDRPSIDSRFRRSGGRLTKQTIGDRDGDLSGAELIDRLVYIGSREAMSRAPGTGS